MSHRVAEHPNSAQCNQRTVPTGRGAGLLLDPSLSYASKASLERPQFGKQKQGSSEFKHGASQCQENQRYLDESRINHHAGQQPFMRSGQEADKQDHEIEIDLGGSNELQQEGYINSSFRDQSKQPSTKSMHARQKLVACQKKENRSSNSKGMTANSHENNQATLNSAFNIGESNRQQPPHVASLPFSPSDTSDKSNPDQFHGTDAGSQSNRSRSMCMTGGQDGASSIIPRTTSLDGSDGGHPQNQVTKKKTASGETNSSGCSSYACQQEYTSSTTSQDVGATTPGRNLPSKSIQQPDHLYTGSGCSTESEISTHCSEHSSSHPQQELVEGNQSLLGKLYNLEKKKYEKEKQKFEDQKQKFEDQKKKFEDQKSTNQQMLEQWKFERAQYERNQKVLEQQLESVKILYKEEKKTSEGLRKMVLEKREGGFSTTEPPYDEISTKYEGIFGAMAKAVVDSCRPPNTTREDKRAHKREWMKCLCHIFQALYSRNKTFLLEHAFSEIFTPRRTLQPDYDPDLSKTEVDAYGHLVEVFFKKHQASQPPDHVVFQMVSRSQKMAKERYGLHVEVDGSIQLERFVREAVRVCWAMLTVNPPMLLDISETSKNEETQRVQLYGVSKDMEDAVEDDAAECNVEFYKPVLYKNFLRDIPTQKGWTGVHRVTNV